MSVPITSVAVEIISRCRFSRSASVRKSILTAVCRLEICNYHHSSVTQWAQGVRAPFCLWANTKRKRKFPQAFIQHPAVLLLHTEDKDSTLYCATGPHIKHSAWSDIDSDTYSVAEGNSDRLWLWLHRNFLLTIDQVSLCTEAASPRTGRTVFCLFGGCCLFFPRPVFI